MRGKQPLYYWDTCLFLAWLKDEERPSGEMDGVREVIRRLRKREVIVMTSVLTLTEVLQSSLPAGVASLFSDLLKRLQRPSIDGQVAKIAHDLRDWYKQRNAEYDGKTLSTPDALHIATAIMYRADEFHTFDSRGRGSSLGLLPLSGNVGGHGLTICKPVANSPELDLRKARP